MIEVLRPILVWAAVILGVAAVLVGAGLWVRHQERVQRRRGTP